MEVDEDRNYVARLNVGQSDMRFRIQAEGPRKANGSHFQPVLDQASKSLKLLTTSLHTHSLRLSPNLDQVGDIEGFQGTTLATESE